mgnify:CR=1 FL=1
MELYKEYPAWLIFFTPYLCGCSGRSGAAFHAFLERPRPLLQLPAPRLVENQR